MCFFEEYPKNSGCFICVALNGQLFGFQKEQNLVTELFYDDLPSARVACIDEKTQWRKMQTA